MFIIIPVYDYCMAYKSFSASGYHPQAILTTMKREKI